MRIQKGQWQRSWGLRSMRSQNCQLMRSWTQHHLDRCEKRELTRSDKPAYNQLFSRHLVGNNLSRSIRLIRMFSGLNTTSQCSRMRGWVRVVPFSLGLAMLVMPRKEMMIYWFRAIMMETWQKLSKTNWKMPRVICWFIHNDQKLRSLIIQIRIMMRLKTGTTILMRK